MGMRRYNHIYKRYYPLNLKLQLLCWFGFYGRFRDKISWKMTLKCVFNSEMYIIYALWHQNHHPYRLIIEFGTNARTSDSAASTVPLGIRFILSSLLSCSRIYAFFCVPSVWRSRPKASMCTVKQLETDNNYSVLEIRKRKINHLNSINIHV